MIGGVKNVVVLGSTGSIGTQSLVVLDQHSYEFNVFALVAFSNVEVIFAQCVKFQPKFAVLVDQVAASILRDRLNSVGCVTQVFSGVDAAIDFVSDDAVDIVIAGIVGAAGLPATFAAAQSGKRILLANKEALVMAGNLFMETVRKHKAVLLPVDSEHNAVFQAFPIDYVPGDVTPSGVSSVVLTASGGPFLHTPLDEMKKITPDQAVAHPTWTMGAKISVDSATMMNKTLEVIEAHFLFSLPPNRIKVWIHPQSIVHALVQYLDGSTVAQMGNPDMRTPITHCLAWPKRMANSVKTLNLVDLPNLSFHAVDPLRYPSFQLGYSAMSEGQSAVITLNAANEIAVAAFLSGKLTYEQIPQLVERTLDGSKFNRIDSLEHVIATDEAARRQADKCLMRHYCS